MKVKIFEHVFSNDERHGTLEEIEGKINRWLETSPGVLIRDIKLSTCAGTNHERAAPTNFAALCLVLYEERG